LDLEIEASFVAEDADRLIDLHEAIADLRSVH